MLLEFMLAVAGGICGVLTMIFISERNHWALFLTILCFIALLFLSNQVLGDSIEQPGYPPACEGLPGLIGDDC